MKLKLIALLALILPISTCYVTHRVKGTVKSENKVDAQIIINYPLCDRKDWTYEQVTTCVDICNDYRATIGADPKLLELLNELLAKISDPDTKALIERMIDDELSKPEPRPTTTSLP